MIQPGGSPQKARRKGGRRRLRDGLPRVFADHRSGMAQALRRAFVVLVTSLELPPGSPLRIQAGEVAMVQLRAHESARQWAELVEVHRRGRGRRPSARQIERARRAAALDAVDARQAEDRLRELAAKGQEQPPTPEKLWEQIKRDADA